MIFESIEIGIRIVLEVILIWYLAGKMGRESANG